METRKFVRRITWPEDPAEKSRLMLAQEWLVTNGLGGYASGTIPGVLTRRYHGLLVAALSGPAGRVMMFNNLVESVIRPNGETVPLWGLQREPESQLVPTRDNLLEFRLENHLPVWRFAFDDVEIEKRLLLIHEQNTVQVVYELKRGKGPLKLVLAPQLQFRGHESSVDKPNDADYRFEIDAERHEIRRKTSDLILRLTVHGPRRRFIYEASELIAVQYSKELDRGYACRGTLWNSGFWEAELEAGKPVAVIASTEEWETIDAINPVQAHELEIERRHGLISSAIPAAHARPAADLVLAADQFLISPLGRVEDTARARAAGVELRTVIAGYHWFTDWGRDTMISLEGLSLVTGRHAEAAWILRTFAHYVRDGLIPNLFPEGHNEGLYHTADATLWFFHALDRYLEYTHDNSTLELLLPKMVDIAEHHLAGTRFQIRVDPEDGLLAQGQEGYQLTWMDAKVDGWVVTPRRGKAVEINALWYNALMLLVSWLEKHGESKQAEQFKQHAEKNRASFNQRFWDEQLGHLIDVVDGENGDEKVCRPNQVFAISLKHPVLDEKHWRPVLDVVRGKLLTPVGLRSLAPGEPGYKPQYFGDLHCRDSAYHQGTVWAWLIGPFVDAWLKVHPEDKKTARSFLEGFLTHLDDACIGSISEIYDAEAPFHPRGCIAQAWSVAELLRAWVKTEPK